MKSALLVVALLFTVFTGVSALASTSIFSGYGYGYGVCVASAPTGLATTYASDYKHIVLSWQAVSFSDCAHAAPASYDLKVRLNDATVIQSFTDIASTQKSIAAISLQSNHSYKFQVRAVASDGSRTKWSLYKLFRTIPATPKQVTIARNATSAFIQWQNVARSKNLRYYRVVIRHRGSVVFSKQVTLGLSKPTTGLVVPHLRPHARYKVWIRAVAPGNVAGEYVKKGFKTTR